MHGEHAEGIKSFHSYIHTLCDLYKIRTIAEEMSLDVMKEKGFSSSGVQQLCTENGLYHQYSDPSREDRKKLNILQEADISAKGFINDWTPKQVDSEILVSYQIRENIWLSRINEFDVWPLLFICGANHFDSFSNLLSENRFEVVKADQDWEPKN